MDNIKDDTYYIEKIKADLKFVIEHTEGKTKEDIENNDLLLDSVMFRIIQIAENNSKLSDKFREMHNEIPWASIKGIRNIIVHAYGRINMTTVYDTVIYDIPNMYEKLKDI